MTPRIVTNAPAPGTDAWKQQITASKIPPMMKNPITGEYLGLGYESARSIYNKITGAGEPDQFDEETLDMFNRGHAMESYAATRWLDQNPGYQLATPHPNGRGGFTSEVSYEQTFDDLHIVATLDNVATNQKDHNDQFALECKAPKYPTDMQQGWRVQHNVQMAVSGIHQGYLLIFPEYGPPRILRHDFEPGLWALTLQCVRDFQQLIIDGTPPPEDDPLRAREELAAEHSDYGGGSIELNPDEHEDLIDRWLTTYQAKEKAEKDYQEACNELGEALGDYKSAKWDGITVVNRSAGRFSQKRYPDATVLTLPEVTTVKPVLDTDKLRDYDPDAYEKAIGPPGYRFTPKNLLK